MTLSVQSSAFVGCDFNRILLATRHVRLALLITIQAIQLHLGWNLSLWNVASWLKIVLRLCALLPLVKVRIPWPRHCPLKLITLYRYACVLPKTIFVSKHINRPVICSDACHYDA
jgi:hypothetical protein